MNQKLNELGCTSTHFVNTNGIQDSNHYSTARDLSTIAKYCMQNSTFRKLVSMKSCTIPKTNKFGVRKYTNTNDSLNPSSQYYRKDCIGIKTGYTSQAKNTLISACSNNDMELIAVLLYSPHLPDRYADLETLYDYGYKTLPALNIQIEDESTKTNELSQTNEQNNEQSNEQSNEQNLLNKNSIPLFIKIILTIIILILILRLMSNFKKKKAHRRKH